MLALSDYLLMSNSGHMAIIDRVLFFDTGLGEQRNLIETGLGFGEISVATFLSVFSGRGLCCWRTIHVLGRGTEDIGGSWTMLRRKNRQSRTSVTPWRSWCSLASAAEFAAEFGRLNRSIAPFRISHLYSSASIKNIGLSTLPWQRDPACLETVE